MRDYSDDYMRGYDCAIAYAISVIQAARAGEIDTDWRSVSSRIDSANYGDHEIEVENVG